MGRPRLANGERPFSVNVYLTAPEWRKLVASAKAEGVSKSEVVRRLLRETDFQLPPEHGLRHDGECWVR